MSHEGRQPANAFSSADLVPHFWRQEVSGVLQPVVERYLTDRESMSLHDIALMRVYVRQWIVSPVWDANPSLDGCSRAELERLRKAVDDIRTVADIHDWLHQALDIGIDPL